METSICSITGTKTYLKVKPHVNTKILSNFISKWQKKNTDCLIITNGSTESHNSLKNQSNMYYMFLTNSEIPQTSDFCDYSNSLKKIQNFVNVSNVEADKIQEVYKYSTSSLEKRVLTKEQEQSYKYLQELKFPKNDSLRALNVFGYDANKATDYLLQTNGVCFEKNPIVQQIPENNNSKPVKKTQQNNSFEYVSSSKYLSNMANLTEFAQLHSKDTRDYCAHDLVIEAENVNALFGFEKAYFSNNAIACVTEAVGAFMLEDRENSCHQISNVPQSELQDLFDIEIDIVKEFLTARINAYDKNIALYLVVLEGLYMKAIDAIENRWENELIRVIDQFQLFVSIVNSI